MDTQEEEESKRVTLRKVIQKKEVGVTFDERQTFEQHILEKVKKANQIMGLVRRCFSYLDILSLIWLLFKAMVRPHFEIAQSLWPPFRKKDIATIENVQKEGYKYLILAEGAKLQKEVKEIQHLCTDESERIR